MCRVLANIYFSIIIPVRNELRYLPRCIAALEAQTFPRENFEIVFVDNGSTDGSREFIESIPNSTLLDCSIIDPYAARNRGIESATGRYFAFLDADCLADSRWLEFFANQLSSSDVKCLAGRVAFDAPQSGIVRDYENYYAAKLKVITTAAYRSRAHLHAGNMVVAREVVERIGGFKEFPIVGDLEFAQRFLNAYPEQLIQYVDSAVVTHLEIDSTSALLKKLLRYGALAQLQGKSRLIRSGDDERTYPGQDSFRGLTLEEKWEVVWQCLRDDEYRLPGQLRLAGSLALTQSAIYLGALIKN